MRRNPRAAEDVRDQQIDGGGGRRLQPLPGVGRVQGDTASVRQRQMFPDQPQQCAVRLHDVLPGAGAGHRHIAGQGQRPAAEVQDVQGRARLRRAVHDVGEPAYVLELQVGRVVEVDVGLGRVVDREQPGPVAVHVGQQPGGAAVDLADDGYRLVHLFIVACSAVRPATPDEGVTGRGGAQSSAVTVPAPTVRPPSRIAKPRPDSSGTSRPSSTVIVTVSPGRATAASPRSTSPTTSAVRM